MLYHKGYRGRVEYDDDASLLRGEVLDMHGMITFYGRSVTEIETEFRRSIDEYLAFCVERGEQPDEPFSETLVLHVPTSLHRDITTRAAREGKTLNQFVTDRLVQTLWLEPDGC